MHDGPSVIPPPQPPLPPALAVVLMAKAARPGQVKTRLSRGPRALIPDQAAAVHAAMLDTVLRRLPRLLRDAGRDALAPRLVAAFDQPALAPAAARRWEVIAQPQGDLGQRMGDAWRRVGGGAAAFFGVDSPDLPGPSVQAMLAALGRGEGALGPVDDGGYYTLAAPRLAPHLLRGIDWGSGAVYDQTRQAAEAARMPLHVLPPWHDVDQPADLRALLERLASTRDPDLQALRQRLTTILHEPP